MIIYQDATPLEVLLRPVGLVLILIIAATVITGIRRQIRTARRLRADASGTTKSD
jgi:hypothetical protein